MHQEPKPSHAANDPSSPKDVGGSFEYELEPAAQKEAGVTEPIPREVKAFIDNLVAFLVEAEIEGDAPHSRVNLLRAVVELSSISSQEGSGPHPFTDALLEIVKQANSPSLRAREQEGETNRVEEVASLLQEKYQQLSKLSAELERALVAWLKHARQKGEADPDSALLDTTADVKKKLRQMREEVEWFERVYKKIYQGAQDALQTTTSQPAENFIRSRIVVEFEEALQEAATIKMFLNNLEKLFSEELSNETLHDATHYLTALLSYWEGWRSSREPLRRFLSAQVWESFKAGFGVGVTTIGSAVGAAALVGGAALLSRSLQGEYRELPVLPPTEKHHPVQPGDVERSSPEEVLRERSVHFVYKGKSREATLWAIAKKSYWSEEFIQAVARDPKMTELVAGIVEALLQQAAQHQAVEMVEETPVVPQERVKALIDALERAIQFRPPQEEGAAKGAHE